MASSVEYSGWGEGPWGYVPWGLDALVITVDGVGGVGYVGEVSVGDATAAADADVSTEGVEATGHIGDVHVGSFVWVDLTGVSGIFGMGRALVWGLVDDRQTPNWQNVPITGTPAWVEISSGSTVHWSEIAT